MSGWVTVNIEERKIATRLDASEEAFIYYLRKKYSELQSGELSDTNVSLQFAFEVEKLISSTSVYAEETKNMLYNTYKRCAHMDLTASRMSEGFANGIKALKFMNSLNPDRNLIFLVAKLAYYSGNPSVGLKLLSLPVFSGSLLEKPSRSLYSKLLVSCHSNSAPESVGAVSATTKPSLKFGSIPELISGIVYGFFNNSLDLRNLMLHYTANPPLVLQSSPLTDKENIHFEPNTPLPVSIENITKSKASATPSEGTGNITVNATASRRSRGRKGASVPVIEEFHSIPSLKDLYSVYEYIQKDLCGKDLHNKAFASIFKDIAHRLTNFSETSITDETIKVRNSSELKGSQISFSEFEFLNDFLLIIKDTLFSCSENKNSSFSVDSIEKFNSFAECCFNIVSGLAEARIGYNISMENVSDDVLLSMVLILWKSLIDDTYPGIRSRANSLSDNCKLLLLEAILYFELNSGENMYSKYYRSNRHYFIITLSQLGNYLNDLAPTSAIGSHATDILLIQNVLKVRVAWARAILCFHSVRFVESSNTGNFELLTAYVQLALTEVRSLNGMCVTLLGPGKYGVVNEDAIVGLLNDCIQSKMDATIMSISDAGKRLYSKAFDDRLRVEAIKNWIESVGSIFNSSAQSSGNLQLTAVILELSAKVIDFQLWLRCAQSILGFSNISGGVLERVVSSAECIFGRDYNNRQDGVSDVRRLMLSADYIQFMEKLCAFAMKTMTNFVSNAFSAADDTSNSSVLQTVIALMGHVVRFESYLGYITPTICLLESLSKCFVCCCCVKCSKVLQNEMNINSLIVSLACILSSRNIVECLSKVGWLDGFNCDYKIWSVFLILSEIIQLENCKERNDSVVEFLRELDYVTVLLYNVPSILNRMMDGNCNGETMRVLLAICKIDDYLSLNLADESLSVVSVVLGVLLQVSYSYICDATVRVTCDSVLLVDGKSGNRQLMDGIINSIQNVVVSDDFISDLLSHIPQNAGLNALINASQCEIDCTADISEVFGIFIFQFVKMAEKFSLMAKAKVRISYRYIFMHCGALHNQCTVSEPRDPPYTLLQFFQSLVALGVNQVSAPLDKREIITDYIEEFLEAGVPSDGAFVKLLRDSVSLYWGFDAGCSNGIVGDNSVVLCGALNDPMISEKSSDVLMLIYAICVNPSKIEYFYQLSLRLKEILNYISDSLSSRGFIIDNPVDIDVLESKSFVSQLFGVNQSVDSCSGECATLQSMSFLLIDVLSDFIVTEKYISKIPCSADGKDYIKKIIEVQLNAAIVVYNYAQHYSKLDINREFLLSRALSYCESAGDLIGQIKKQTSSEESCFQSFASCKLKWHCLKSKIVTTDNLLAIETVQPLLLYLELIQSMATCFHDCNLLGSIFGGTVKTSGGVDFKAVTVLSFYYLHSWRAQILLRIISKFNQISYTDCAPIVQSLEMHRFEQNGAVLNSIDSSIFVEIEQHFNIGPAHSALYMDLWLQLFDSLNALKYCRSNKADPHFFRSTYRIAKVWGDILMWCKDTSVELIGGKYELNSKSVLVRWVARQGQLLFAGKSTNSQTQKDEVEYSSLERSQSDEPLLVTDVTLDATTSTKHTYWTGELTIPSYSAWCATEQMHVLFNKKRAQLMAIWKSGATDCYLDEFLNQREVKFNNTRVKYLSFYLESIQSCNRLDYAEDLLSTIVKSSDDNACSVQLNLSCIACYCTVIVNLSLLEMAKPLSVMTLEKMLLLINRIVSVVSVQKTDIVRECLAESFVAAGKEFLGTQIVPTFAVPNVLRGSLAVAHVGPMLEVGRLLLEKLSVVSSGPAPDPQQTLEYL